MQGRALAGVDQGHPVGVDVREFLFVLDAAAAVRKIFLVERVLLKSAKRGFGGRLRVFAFGGGAAVGESLGLLLGGLAGLFIFFQLGGELRAPSGELLLLLVGFVEGLL